MAPPPDTNSAKVQQIRSTPDTVVADVERLGGVLSEAGQAIGKVIMGLDSVIEETMVALLSGGHVLLIGVPGLGKTKLVATLGVVFGLDERRVQCTPDLMPADILGSEVLEESDRGKRSFRFIRGPVFCQLLMADEINRASPRTQSALLQAMQEGRISVGGKDHALPVPFHVLATQNPLEQEGTYPLPEAQLDRFFMQIDVGYPDLDAERRVLAETTGAVDVRPAAVLGADDLLMAQRLLRHVPVGDSVVDGILRLVRAARPGPGSPEDICRHVSWGPGPRASQALMMGVRARAVIRNRLSPDLDDVVALARPVLRHRMALNFAARAEGMTIETIIARLLKDTV